jgi:hypothetical protein
MHRRDRLRSDAAVAAAAAARRSAEGISQTSHTISSSAFDAPLLLRLMAARSLASSASQ